jgi:hypothetical protein
MTSYLRPLPLAAGLLLLTAVTSANPAPATPRIDDDTHFADWLSAVPSATDPDLYEVDAGRTFAPERLREVRIWVDTAGLTRYDDLAEDGEAYAGKDNIGVEEIRRQELFRGQSKGANTTATDAVDSGEVFVFREHDTGDEFNKLKGAVLDGKFRVRILPSAAGEYALKRVHLTVHLRPRKR